MRVAVRFPSMELACPAVGAAVAAPKVAQLHLKPQNRCVGGTQVQLLMGV